MKKYLYYSSGVVIMGGLVRDMNEKTVGVLYLVGLGTWLAVGPGLSSGALFF